MAKLILHSDDFGLHPAINRAITEAAQHGALTSASLMANGLAAKEAIACAKDIPSLNIGLHLNILRGKPLSDPSQIESIVQPNGLFLNSPLQLMTRSFSNKLCMQHIFTEYRNQFRFMLDHGVMPTHLDGEKHTHLMIPEARQAIHLLKREFGIERVRIVREHAVIRQLTREGITLRLNPKQQMKLAILEHYSKRAKRDWKGFKTVDATFGVSISGIYEQLEIVQVMKALFDSSEFRSVEWIFHLGYGFDRQEPSFQKEFGNFFLNGDAGQNELNALRSDTMLELLHLYRDQLISYRDL